jgi:hypothetical protein
LNESTWERHIQRVTLREDARSEMPRLATRRLPVAILLGRHSIPVVLAPEWTATVAAGQRLLAQMTHAVDNVYSYDHRT